MNLNVPVRMVDIENFLIWFNYKFFLSYILIFPNLILIKKINYLITLCK